MMTFMMWTGVTASADETSSVADDTVAAIDAVAGQSFDNAIGVSIGDSTITAAGGLTVDLSNDAAEGISIDSPTAGALDIGLPFADTAGDAQVVDGVMVYDNGNGSSTTPLVNQDGSVQILTTIADGSAPTAYEYIVEVGDGASLELTADGGAIAVGVDGVATASIAPPWAYDATGAAVPTWYEVSGSSLVQHIEHAGVAYPVVADPKVSLGWKIYVKYSNWEAKNLTSGWVGNVTDKAKYSALLCAGLLSGGPIGAIGAAVCGAYVYEVIESVISTMKKAASKGECVELQYTYNGALVGWKGYKC